MSHLVCRLLTTVYCLLNPAGEAGVRWFWVLQGQIGLDYCLLTTVYCLLGLRLSLRL
jgi:hypothetical protein